MRTTATPGSVYAIHTYKGWRGYVGITCCKKHRRHLKKALKDAAKLQQKMLDRAERGTG